MNNRRIENEDWSPQPTDFLHGNWLVLRRGKRNIAGVERVLTLVVMAQSGCPRTAEISSIHPSTRRFDSVFSLT